jgi:hypothetical protein
MVAANTAEPAASVVTARRRWRAVARVREDADLAVVAARAEVTLEMVVEAAKVQIAVDVVAVMATEVL